MLGSSADKPELNIWGRFRSSPNTMWIRFLATILFPVFAFAATTMKTDHDGFPILNQYSEEGFVDCVLQISDLTETSTLYRFHLAATSNGELVGINVDVVKNIHGGFDSGMNLDKSYVYKRGVTFMRSGPESDRLISTLAGLYGDVRPDLKMIELETFTAIALHQGALDMLEIPIKLKLFGRDSEPFDDDAYYESFFNLDLKNRVVYWNEKDPDYRVPLIRGLTE